MTGVLKGFDQLLNLVLDECLEYLRDPDDPLKITDETRSLGLIVCRGTSVMVVSGLDGMEEIPNPFLAAEDGGAVMAGGVMWRGDDDFGFDVERLTRDEGANRLDAGIDANAARRERAKYRTPRTLDDDEVSRAATRGR